jgi:hypothetical protein
MLPHAGQKKSHPKVALKVPGGTSLDLLEVRLFALADLRFIAL